MGGAPVIRGTRVPVRTIAALIEDGESYDLLREDYPHVPEEAYEVAVLWARANPRCGPTVTRRHFHMHAVALAARSVTFPP